MPRRWHEGHEVKETKGLRFVLSSSSVRGFNMDRRLGLRRSASCDDELEQDSFGGGGGDLCRRRCFWRKCRGGVEGWHLRHSPPRLHLVWGRDGRLHRADIEGGHYEHNAWLAGLHRRLAVIAHAGFRWDWVGDLGVTPITRDDNKKRTDPFLLY